MTADNVGATKSGFGVTVLLLLVVVVVGTVAAIYAGQTQPAPSTTSLTLPDTVAVFGVVGSTGAGTHPVSMSFKSIKTSASFSAPVSSGHFSIQLAN